MTTFFDLISHLIILTNIPKLHFGFSKVLWTKVKSEFYLTQTEIIVNATMHLATARLQAEMA